MRTRFKIASAVIAGLWLAFGSFWRWMTRGEGEPLVEGDARVEEYSPSVASAPDVKERRNRKLAVEYDRE